MENNCCLLGAMVVSLRCRLEVGSDRWTLESRAMMTHSTIRCAGQVVHVPTLTLAQIVLKAWFIMRRNRKVVRIVHAPWGTTEYREITIYCRDSLRFVKRMMDLETR